MLFPKAQQVNLTACSHCCSFNADERQAGKLWMPILKSLLQPTRNLTQVYGSREADALTTRLSEPLSLLSLELLSLHYSSFPIFALFSNDSGFLTFPISVFQQDALFTFPSFSESFSDFFRHFRLFLFPYFIKISAISIISVFSDIFAF